MISATSVNDYRSGTVLPWHAHELPTLSIVVHGWQVERVGSSTLRRDPLSVVYKAGGFEHDNRIGGDATRALLVELVPKGVEEVALALREGPRDQAGQVAGLRLAAANLCRAALLEPAELTEAVLWILAELAGPRGERRPPSWLRACREQVCDQYVEPPSLSALATHHGVHPVHVAQAFRRHFGHTVGDLVRRRRVERVLELMTTTGASLAEIATTVGFSDQSHMTRVFRRIVGVAPGRFRRRLLPP
jgi:AraC family transcriptional regulator